MHNAQPIAHLIKDLLDIVSLVFLSDGYSKRSYVSCAYISVVTT